MTTMVASITYPATATIDAQGFVKVKPARTIVRTCGNRKVGAHTTTTSRPRSTCPRDCDAWDECYGTNYTQSGGTLFDNVDAAPATSLGLKDIARTIARKANRATRYSVVGDVLKDDGTVVDREYVAAMNDGAAVAREHGTPVWSYTHAWSTNPNREHVVPGDFTFTVRASCASVDKVREAHAAGWCAALVVEPGSDLVGSTIDGRRVVLCEAQRHDIVKGVCRTCGPNPAHPERTCETCANGKALCSIPAAVVAFEAHGAASDRKRAR